MTKLVFLSHIHEERELAILFKEALEDEFSGFVDVFVSSDGTSIPAGANFLKRIEDGLATCAAALYLISPKSVSRQWINFELGAVWLRNVISTNAGGSTIPALPVCHSGSSPATLPAPLNNLNGIVAAESAQLEFAFKSIQTAMGGRGKLKTDFDELAMQVIQLERKYTIGANLKLLIDSFPITPEMRPQFVEEISNNPMEWVCIEDFSFTDANWKRIHHLSQNELQGLVKTTHKSSQTLFGSSGNSNRVVGDVTVLTAVIRDHKKALLG